MSDFAANLPGHFRLHGVRAVKERGYYLCKTKTDVYKIHKSQEHHNSIKLRYRLLTQLDEAGFPWIDRISPSVYGTPFVQLGRETFVMSRYVPGRDLDLDCPQNMTLALECLARFHKAARGLQFTQELIPGVSPPLPEIFAKNSAFLAKTARQTNKNSRLSDFDVMFIKSSPQYISASARSAELLAQTNYHRLYNTAIAENHICHNALKEENMPVWDGNCYMINWNEAAIDAQITDLANFLRRYARRSKREIPLTKLMDIYDGIFPLPVSAKAIVYAQLVHPWQYIKITQQYYSKKRGWTPAAIMTRMAELLKEQENYDAYINALL
ncbi:MAG: phosphotransferase [Firmicutes bacterium]|nr:phosphotransferase [Bacillota bacterium]